MMLLILNIILGLSFHCVEVNAEGFYNIAHMTNNIPAVDFAVTSGANAVEIDLQFSDNGTPFAFFHSAVCDCACMCAGGGCGVAFPGSVCYQLEKTSKSPCNARTDATKLLNYIATKRRNIMLVMIDSKLTDNGKKMSSTVQRIAAGKVMELLEKELFGKGYFAEVVIGAPYFASFPYIEEIAKLAASKPSTKNSIHFTIDMESATDLKKRLDFRFNKNLVYNLGISTCSPKFVATAELSKLAAINKAKGYFGMTYTWTVDKSSTLEYYTRYFTGIITNYPALLTEVVKKQGIKLATYKDRIPETISGIIETDTSLHKCRCHYTSGGCQIVEPAPKGMACRCKNSFIATCWEAKVVLCSNMDDPQCKSPSASKASCLLGRGNCNGYSF